MTASDNLDPEQVRKVVCELANALQSALLLASRLEPGLRQAARDAGDLLAAIDRAATAVQQLRPDATKGGAQ